MKITVLGCGASSGVPVMGCDCTVCKSTNPKNNRSRVSVHVESNDTGILVDTSPDLRTQAIRSNIRKVDGIIYTHAHADHINGIDDTRSFNFFNDAPLDIYTDEKTVSELKERFSYVFLPPKPLTTGWYRPCLNPILVEPPYPFKIKNVEVRPFWQTHGGGSTIGLRIGSFAYSTDTNALPDDAIRILKGVEIWIVDCLRYVPALTHSHLEKTLGWIKQVNPRKAYLTHMNHEMDYDTLIKELPENVLPAYDGMVIEV